MSRSQLATWKVDLKWCCWWTNACLGTIHGDERLPCPWGKEHSFGGFLKWFEGIPHFRKPPFTSYLTCYFRVWTEPGTRVLTHSTFYCTDQAWQDSLRENGLGRASKAEWTAMVQIPSTLEKRGGICYIMLYQFWRCNIHLNITWSGYLLIFPGELWWIMVNYGELWWIIPNMPKRILDLIAAWSPFAGSLGFSSPVSTRWCPPQL